MIQERFFWKKFLCLAAQSCQSSSWTLLKELPISPLLSLRILFVQIFILQIILNFKEHSPPQLLVSKAAQLVQRLLFYFNHIQLSSQLQASEVGLLFH